MDRKQILALAVPFAISCANNKVASCSSLLRAALDRCDTILDPASKAETYVRTVNEAAGSPTLASARQFLKTVEVLKDWQRRLEADANATLSWEFYVGRAQEDYTEEGCHDPNHVIVESKVTGNSGALLSVLRAAGGNIVWQPRPNGFKASFTLSA